MPLPVTPSSTPHAMNSASATASGTSVAATHPATLPDGALPLRDRPGQKMLMTSLTVPILKEGKFVGIAGVDMNLPIFQQLAEQLGKQLYDNQAEVTLVSKMGLIAGSNRHAGKLGRPDGGRTGCPGTDSLRRQTAISSRSSRSGSRLPTASGG